MADFSIIKKPVWNNISWLVSKRSKHWSLIGQKNVTEIILYYELPEDSLSQKVWNSKLSDYFQKRQRSSLSRGDINDFCLLLLHKNTTKTVRITKTTLCYFNLWVAITCPKISVSTKNVTLAWKRLNCRKKNILRPFPWDSWEIKQLLFSKYQWMAAINNFNNYESNLIWQN